MAPRRRALDLPSVDGMLGRAAGVLAGLALCVTLAACSGEPEPEAEAARVHIPLTIAFAGDVHFAGVLADRLSDPVRRRWRAG